MELVSVVVPIYNVERYLDRCVESIRKQTYENIEIILVDDGSPDRCGKMCDIYAAQDSRIKVLHKKNGGLSDARNRGAQEAKGKYLFFVDSDDSVSPRMIEKAVCCAKEHDAEMVIFDFESIEEETGRRDVYHFALPEKKIINLETNPELLIKTPSACCRMYKKEFWERIDIRYPEGIHYEDLATTPRMILKADQIAYTGEEPLYYYMLRQGSIMRSKNFEKSYKDRTCVLDYLKRYFQEQEAYQKYQREIEYLFFEHGYFVPSKEIILVDTKSSWLKKFKEYTLDNFPQILKNPYIRQLSIKDKILLELMKKEWYGIMNLLSGARKTKDKLKK